MNKGYILDNQILTIKLETSQNNVTIPVKIYRERRKNVRAAIGKTAIILRMPLNARPTQQQQWLRWFHNWVKIQFETDQKLHSRFIGRTYKDGMQLEVYGKVYTINLVKEVRKTHSVQLKGKIIYLKISTLENDYQLQKKIRQLLGRVIAKDCLPAMKQRINELNNTYFQETINQIRFKNNQSNWGSCSSNRNLNFATRLLFAPQPVIDYIIIHELAHLKELNHSPRFWKIVGKVMPNYKEKEKWLKENGHKCQF